MTCSLTLAPRQGSLAGGAGARPDHPISGQANEVSRAFGCLPHRSMTTCVYPYRCWCCPTS